MEIPSLIDDVVAATFCLTYSYSDSTAEPTFCARVTPDEFKQQQTETTETVLVSLMNAILDDHKMALRDKKNHLKQFQKHHSELYDRNFSDVL